MPGMEPRNTFLQRLVGAAALDAAIYEEVEVDPSATGQALVVVLASSLAAGIGVGGADPFSLARVAFFGTVALLAWAGWALLTFEVGTRLMPGPQTRSTVGELLRTLGFAATPGVLHVFGVLPGITMPVFIGTSVWMLLAMIVAVRQALDYQHTRRAVAVCLFGWLLVLTLAIGVGMLFGPSVS
jgi:hypothetical protein